MLGAGNQSQFGFQLPVTHQYPQLAHTSHLYLYPLIRTKVLKISAATFGLPLKEGWLIAERSVSANYLMDRLALKGESLRTLANTASQMKKLTCFTAIADSATELTPSLRTPAQGVRSWHGMRTQENSQLQWCG